MASPEILAQCSLRRKWVFPALLIALAAVGFVYYSPQVKNNRLFGDNEENYRETADRNTVSTILDPFLVTTSLGGNSYFCPVQSAVWLGLARAFGNETKYYFLVGVLIHLTAAMLLAVLARSLMGSDLAAVAAAALFLFYSPHIDSLIVLSALITHGLAVAFSLATMIFFFRFLRRSRAADYGAALAFWVLALLTKETAWCVLPVMVAADYLLFRPKEPGRLTPLGLADFFNKYFPFLFALLGAMTIFVLKYPSSTITRSWGGVSVSVNILYRFLDLFSMLLVPHALPDWTKLVLVDAAILGVYLAFALGDARLKWFTFWAMAGVAFYCVSNFRPSSDLPRYLYMSSCPLALALVYGLVWSRGKPWWVSVPLGGLPVFVLAAHLFVGVHRLWP
jgi:hypothetical protein